MADTEKYTDSDIRTGVEEVVDEYHAPGPWKEIYAARILGNIQRARGKRLEPVRPKPGDIIIYRNSGNRYEYIAHKVLKDETYVFVQSTLTNVCHTFTPGSVWTSENGNALIFD